MIDFSNLQLHILKPRELKQNTWLLNAAFEHWNHIWNRTLEELDGLKDLRSDDFTRQDEILCLFDGEKCVGMICHRLVDLKYTCHSRDSYFKSWTPDAIESLTRYGSRVLVGSQISVEPEWRGKINGYGIKELLSALSLESLFTRNNIDAITGTMRADRGMHNLFYEFGARPLKRGVLFHGVKVDLVAFYPRQRNLKIPADLHQIMTKLTDFAIKKAA
jgi:hypothetical protein